ncbi:energy-coupled thiamine transporter ThiT [Ruminococcaceae bacterium OttesenSCG-928-O06]|nr:energy-coupled thiamine transporter ThiT [Ruminococcaceae bacterium OttesenSCG-928-O06]
MKAPQQMSRTAVLVEGALMVALAFVLSYLSFQPLPWGGDITLLSTLPIVMMSLRHGAKWGVGTAGVYSLLQLVQGMPNVVAVPVKTVWTMALCALLDYVLAYTALGFSGPIAQRFKHRTAGIAAGIALTGLARFACSFLSGVLIWGQFAWDGWPVWLYSLAYNASWCLPDVFLTLVAALLLSRVRVLGLLPQQHGVAV